MATGSVNVDTFKYTTMDGQDLEVYLYRHKPERPVEVSYIDRDGEPHSYLDIDPFDMRVFEAYVDAEQERLRREREE